MTCQLLCDQARVIFLDLDGVIVDSEPMHLIAWNAALADRGMDRTLSIGETAGIKDEAIAHSIDAANAELLVNLKKAHERKYVEQHSLPLVPGTRECMEHWKKQGKVLAVVSNSSDERIEEWCRHHDVWRFLAFVVGARGRLPSKPDPAVYRSALALASVEPADAVAIEDSLAGVAAARAAGVPVIGLATSVSEQVLTREATCATNSMSSLIGSAA